jgi:hypothetical protein
MTDRSRFLWRKGDIERTCEGCGRGEATYGTLCDECADLIDRQTEALLEERYFEEGT